jgi:hypothetical protein
MTSIEEWDLGVVGVRVGCYEPSPSSCGLLPFYT